MPSPVHFIIGFDKMFIAHLFEKPAMCRTPPSLCNTQYSISFNKLPVDGSTEQSLTLKTFEEEKMNDEARERDDGREKHKSFGNAPDEMQIKQSASNRGEGTTTSTAVSPRMPVTFQ
ncbi:uncharacterized protein MONOS_6880 [Monocercomonoides exilis]|uniref:uncharacterized protein n=1 Tax=Monocercomonoides exilis TaxID=2049356 RepID=UPI00355A81D1|nr:hypothetical protein MONOS_6880 [Monocercomonoides exilis]|eukprot:MONOS_6880.1-p1 / transcript=MONOS_6880.1 / gene=MONOS_6880 / organism=Monocercomonoides_exilis_PA203 / gene_product=unspecified product / transcript_product=unspecified product / location=Mono_scaffold00225:47024-47374(-) / protein_length=117 / sequence_SO=supercontig / SO=protein_coding / is_pseudo=false